MEAWRSNYHGLQARFKKTNFILYGSVDDIWLDTKNNYLILVDYKSQANEKEVSQETYWDGDFKTGYQTQLDFYFYLLKQQNFKEIRFWETSPPLEFIRKKLFFTASFKAVSVTFSQSFNCIICWFVLKSDVVQFFTWISHS